MLEHLLDPEFTDAYTAEVPTLLAAQATTADLLIQLGSPEHVLAEDEKHKVREAFAAVTAGDPNANVAILKNKVPEAVKHLSGMLSQYDWEFVEQAKEIRSYIVAKLLEETKHPEAKIRLNALKILGTVTEVGAFTEKIEVKKIEMADHEIEAKIKEKLNRFMGVVDVVEASAKSDDET
jgi:hypothetical protein